MTSRLKVHLDASTPGAAWRTSACGFTFVVTEIDASKITCGLCIRLMNPKQAPKDAEIDAHLAAALAPKADAPPRLTAPLWASSCKGGQHRRCGECELCRWEREAAKWEHAAPDRHRQLFASRPVGAPRWPSLSAALIALADWERRDRHANSTSAGILARLLVGAVDGGPMHPGDPMQNAADEIVAVRQALELACPEGAHAVLTRAQCMAITLVRTPGVEDVLPSYEALAQHYHTTAGDLRALVRSIRQRVTAELAARGLIPVPEEKPRRGTPCQARF